MNSAYLENRRQKVVFIIEHMSYNDFSSLYYQLQHIPELKPNFLYTNDVGTGGLIAVHYDWDNKKFITNKADVTGKLKFATVVTAQNTCRMLFNSDDDAAEMICSVVLGGSIGGLECASMPTNTIIASCTKKLVHQITKANHGSPADVISTLKDIIYKITRLSLLPEASKNVLDLFIRISSSLMTTDKPLLDLLDASILPVLETLRQQNTVYNGVYEGQNFDVTDYVARVDVARLPRTSATLRRLFMMHIYEDGKKYFYPPKASDGRTGGL